MKAYSHPPGDWHRAPHVLHLQHEHAQPPGRCLCKSQAWRELLAAVNRLFKTLCCRKGAASDTGADNTLHLMRAVCWKRFWIVYMSSGGAHNSNNRAGVLSFRVLQQQAEGEQTAPGRIRRSCTCAGCSAKNLRAASGPSTDMHGCDHGGVSVPIVIHSRPPWNL
jgi:hypothetical protein